MRGVGVLRRRGEYAIKAMLRRRANAKKKAEKREYEEYKLQLVEMQKITHAAKKLAAKHRKEDYELGPLAPWRQYDEDEPLAALSVLTNQRPKVPEHRRRTPWLATGDRVLFLKGQDKGQIGTVSSVDAESETLAVRGLNMVCSQTYFLLTELRFRLPARI